MVTRGDGRMVEAPCRPLGGVDGDIRLRGSSKHPHEFVLVFTQPYAHQSSHQEERRYPLKG
jgi:hypothetical protein